MKTKLALAACILSLSLAGCQVNEGQRPQLDNYASVSPEPAPTVAAPEGTPDLQLVDVSPGGPKERDPLWTTLEQAAGQSAPVYLDVYVYYDSKLPDTDQVSLTADIPNSVTVTVDKDAVDAKLAPFYRISGTFTAEMLADSTFTLTTVNTDRIDGLVPDGPSTEERCTADDAQDRIGTAFEELASDPNKREELRLQWLSSPEVWWGIQLTAAELVDTDGGTEGDFISQACYKYLG